VHLWIGIGSAENHLHVIASRPKTGKLRHDR